MPPFRVQTFTVTEPKVLVDEVSTSKYSPVELKLGVPAGSAGYCDTVSAPGPVDAVTVTPPLDAWQAPEMTAHVEWLLALLGGAGGEGGDGGGGGDGVGVVVAVTVNAVVVAAVRVPLVAWSL